MARAKRRKLGGQDLCKIDTTRLRALSADQAAKAARRVSSSDKPAWRSALKSFLYAVKNAKTPLLSAKARNERWDTRMGSQSPYVQMLHNDIRRERPDLYYPASYVDTKPAVRIERQEEWNEVRDEHYARDLETQRRDRVSAMKDLNFYEKKIWAAQAKAGCELRPEEMVARDAIEQGTPERAAEVRAGRSISVGPHLVVAAARRWRKHCARGPSVRAQHAE